MSARLMSVDAFLEWTAVLRGPERFELLRGEPVAMAPELPPNGEVKALVTARFVNAIAGAGLPCRTLVDSVGVRAGHDQLFIPDVVIHCGAPPPLRRELADPLVVVEIVSPSTSRFDHGPKLIGYFTVPSIRHYLIVSPLDRTIIHHERRADGGIETHLCGDGPVRLDPPGLTLADVFPAA